MSQASRPPQEQQQQPISHNEQTQQPVHPKGHIIKIIYPSSHRVWTLKLNLRIISIISCLTLIGLIIGVGETRDMLPLLLFCPPTAISIFWNFAESRALFIRGGHRGIHPGAIVAIDLLLCLSYIVGITYLGLFGLAVHAYNEYDEYGDLDDDYDDGPSQAITPICAAIIAFAVIELLIHLVLFVVACWEADVRRKNTQIVHVQPPNGRVPNCQIPSQDQFKAEMPTTVTPAH